VKVSVVSDGKLKSDCKYIAIRRRLLSYQETRIFHLYIANLGNVKDIEMRPMAFERKSSKGSQTLYRDCAKTETRCISEPFEIQTKVREIQTGTNDSLSNCINEIKKFLNCALAIFYFLLFV